MDTETPRIKLPRLAPVLRERTVAGTPPTYPQLWRAAVNGDLPGADQDRHGRWSVPESGVAEVAAAFGLTVE